MLVCIAVLIGCKDDPESSGAKSENSALTAMMLRHDSERIDDVRLFTEMGHHFVCIPYEGRRVWVMLDARYAPYYKQQPWDQNFFISRADFERIEQSNLATPVVVQCLASHISPN